MHRVDSIEKRNHRPKAGESSRPTSISTPCAAGRRASLCDSISLHADRAHSGGYLDFQTRRRENRANDMLDFKTGNEIPIWKFAAWRESENEVASGGFFHFDPRFVIRTLPLNCLLLGKKTVWKKNETCFPRGWSLQRQS